jgi:ubiquinone biosynthesis accessory factor UbiJ
MLKTTAFMALEKMVNFAFSRDENSVQRLAVLEDKIICIEFTDISLKMFWLFENSRVRILTAWRDNLDVKIEGSVSAIAKIGLTKAKTAKDLTISGDMHVVEAFKELFAKLDIDWEAQVSPFVGDALAYKLGKTAKELRGWLKGTTKTLAQTSKEFAQEEVQCLPSRTVFEEFSQDVRALNRRVDKLAARIKRLA